MIKVDFLRSNSVRLCSSCGTMIEKEQPFFIFRFSNGYYNFCLCEDCGNDLQNDMNDEYQRFVDK